MDGFALLLVGLAIVFSPTLLAAIVAYVVRGRISPVARVGAVVATFIANGAAFWFWLSQQNFSKGRILRLRERRPPRFARLARSTGWDAPAPEVDLSGLSPVRRAAVMTLWLQSARMEHASVVAFGRLAEILVGLGAPADLVRRAHEAALDEIRHAEAFFGLASGGSPRPWGAGEFPALLDAPAPSRPRSREAAVRSLVKGSLHDGALAEGVASRVAAEVARVTPHPGLAALFRTIAEDERRHAELGLDVLCFALEVAPRWAREELRHARRTLEAARSHHAPSLPDDLAAYGLLPAATLDALAAEELADVARAVDALLAADDPLAAADSLAAADPRTTDEPTRDHAA